MRTRKPSRSLVLVLAFALLALVPGPVVANTGSPPAVRTSTGGVIVRDILTEHRRYRDWHLSLLDPIFMLPSSYAPGDLVSVASAGIAGSGYVRRLVIADLRAMDQSARAAGVRLKVISAYRSYRYQKTVFDRWVATSGYSSAVRYSARPGHSEHQLGTSIDFTFMGGVEPWRYSDFGATKAGAWLKRNAWKFGFVMSYPKGKEHLTGYIYEPWHFRYFGRSLALDHRLSGMVPRYWLWKRN